MQFSDEQIERILHVLESQKFYNWYIDRDFATYIEGQLDENGNTISADEIRAQIKEMFS